MHVSGLPLLIFHCLHFFLFILLIGKKYFGNYASKKTVPPTCKGTTKVFSWQSLSKKILRNCSLNSKHFDQSGNRFYLRSNRTFRMEMLSSEGRRQSSYEYDQDASFRENVTEHS